MTVPPLLLSAAKEYLEVGGNESLQVVDQMLSEEIAATSADDRSDFASALAGKFRALADQTSASDEDRLRILLETLAQYRT